MNAARFTIGLFALLALTSPNFADEKEDQLAEKYPLLARLHRPSDELPPHCKVREFPDDIPQLKGLKNLTISTDPKHFLIVDERLAQLVDVKTIKAMYFGCYLGKSENIEQSEFGIVGWAFTNVEQAKAAHKAIAASYANEPERFRLWQVDHYVIWLWRDHTSEECFESFERFVDSQLKEPVAKR